MKITLEVSNITITTAELAKWCVSADDARSGPIPIDVETAIKYAFVAGVEQGWRNPPLW